MKDHPEATDPPSDNLGEPETARESSVILRYGETDWYIFHIVVFTMAGVITMIVHQVIAPIGSPLDTIRSIIFSMGNIAGMGLAYAIAVALVTKTVRSVYRRQRQLPFRSRERKPRK